MQYGRVFNSFQELYNECDSMYEMSDGNLDVEIERVEKILQDLKDERLRRLDEQVIQKQLGIDECVDGDCADKVVSVEGIIL